MTLEREDAEFTDHEGKRTLRATVLTDPHMQALHIDENAPPEVRDILQEAAEALDMDLVLLGHVNRDVYTVVAAYRRNPSYALETGATLPILETYCRQEITWETPFILGDALASETFRDHPGMTKHGLRAYVGSPVILADGTVYGTLCGVDRNAKVVPLAGVERLLRLSKRISDLIWSRLHALDQA